MPQLQLSENALFGVTSPEVIVFTPFEEYNIFDLEECVNNDRCTCADEFLIRTFSDSDTNDVPYDDCMQACSNDDSCRFVYTHQPIQKLSPGELS